MARLGQVLASATIYFVAVKLTLLLTLPLGFPHLLWPAAGFAMLCAMRWGVAGALGAGLGRVLLDVANLVEVGGSALSPQDFWIASIARPGGVVLQAYAAVWLQQQFQLGSLNGMVAPLRPLLRTIIIGPGACLIGATIAVLSLPTPGPHAEPERFLFWLAFWTGDSLAVIAVLPLASLLGLTQRPEPSVIGSSPITVALLLLVCAGGWAATGYVHHSWLDRAKTRFSSQVDEVQSDFKARLDDARLMLVSLRAFFASSDEVTASEFRRFSEQLLDSRPDDLSLGWVDRTGGVPAKSVLRHFHPKTASALELAGHLLDAETFSNALRHASIDDRVQNVHHSNQVHVPKVAWTTLLLLPVYNPDLGRRFVDGFAAACLNIDQIAADVLRSNRGLPPQTRIKVSAVRPAASKPASTMPSAQSTLTGSTTSPAERTLPGFTQSRTLQLGDSAWSLQLSMPRSGGYRFLADPTWWGAPILVQLLTALLCGTLLLARADAVRRLEQGLTVLWDQFVQGGGSGASAPAKHEATTASTQARLRQAFANDEFVPYFQPIVNLGNGRVEGVEALLRWPTSPDRIQIPTVINWAEDTGAIVELGGRTLIRALDVLNRWRRTLDYSGWIAVNVSAIQMHDPNWVDATLTALRNADLPGDRLVLEITESLLVQTEGTAEQIGRLRQAGVHVSLDDFGVGYSSMSYLHRLPVDQLKLDRSFVAGLGHDPIAQEIVRNVVSLARALKLEVTGEGIEDAATAVLLRQLGCQLGQGWLFSKAVDEKAAAVLIQRGFPRPGKPPHMDAGAGFP